ncbi:MAG: hypothetical protein ABSC32_10580 [Steroidobacteraceae bacterium]|jgi:hypothetical protein
MKPARAVYGTGVGESGNEVDGGYVDDAPLPDFIELRSSGAPGEEHPCRLLRIQRDLAQPRYRTRVYVGIDDLIRVAADGRLAQDELACQVLSITAKLIRVCD